MLAEGITLLPSPQEGEETAGEPMLEKVCQLIESVNDTLEGQLDLEHHGGRTCEGVAISRPARRGPGRRDVVQERGRSLGHPLTDR